MTDLSGKTILVTGSSRGIGAATAVMAASRGANVVVNYTNRGGAADAVVKTIEADGGTAIAIQADVGEEAAVIEMFNLAVQTFGRVDSLVNNAGILHQLDRLENYSADRITEVVRVNVVGAFLCAREAVRHMSTTKGGAGGNIVNVSSVASYLGSPNEFIDYAATKGAMDAMTIGLSKEVALDGIRVNAVRPGLIHTDIHETAGSPDRVERLSANVPMGRGGMTDEVAETILWLASDAASYVSGSLVNCSGGR